MKLLSCYLKIIWDKPDLDILWLYKTEKSRLMFKWADDQTYFGMNCSFISFIYIKENSVTDIITHSKSCSGENDTNLKECPVQYSEYQYGVK